MYSSSKTTASSSFSANGNYFRGEKKFLVARPGRNICNAGLRDGCVCVCVGSLSGVCILDIHKAHAHAIAH